MGRFVLLPAVLAMAVASGGCAKLIYNLSGNGLRNHAAAMESPAPWAHPIEGPGLFNAFQVDERLYRGGYPSAEGMRTLAGMGVRTVVNLRLTSDGQADLSRSGVADIEVVWLPMKPWGATVEQVAQFLRIVYDPDRAPVYVHCSGGADRAGLMVAVYRVAVQGWTKEQAAREMTEGGFWFHARFWSGLIEDLYALDVDEARRLAGLEAPPPRPISAAIVPAEPPAPSLLGDGPRSLRQKD